ncbi:phage tail protein [Enterobacter cloacae complex sp. 2022EL-00788]|uniref:phage tail-collar fiber domain-containing protein n=1 Tax=Enterobacter cloacae complex sp. 2022EL-00788 TaxID=2996512 RepID=UPI00226D8D26|nr:phage tail protein [Enterobacter cloacae complex sp. 2022EL-00788]MCY0772561.1 phage tail protein [Enterobacter cloacae complex sp. 2022EL-00788]
MTVKYKTVITKAGAEKLAAATVPNAKKVNFTAMAVGDGGGALPVPDASKTKLVNEVWRHALNKISQDKKNKNYVVAELLIPPEVGGFWMREMGLYDDTGTLIAIGNMAESYKPALAEGSGRAQTVRMVIMVSDIASVELTIDTSTVMATQDYVDGKLTEHEQSRRHPDATLTAKGFTQLSSAVDSTSEVLAATPKAVKAAYDLANGKYTAGDATTARKGIVQLSSATDSTSESVAATPKSVKAAYDLAKGKYTAQDATTAQKGIVQLSSATDSVSEALAATPKAVKAANDNANGRVPSGRKVNGRALSADISITAQDIFNGQTVSIGNAADLNAYTTPGLYYQPANAQAQTGKNYPEANAGSLEVYKHAGVTQIYRIYNSSRSYIRSLYSGTWSGWVKQYDAANKPSPADIGAVNKSSDTMTGRLIMNVDGEAIRLQPKTAGYASYIVSYDSANKNHWYVGAGSTTNANITLLNYKGANNSISLNSDGTVNLNPTQGKSIISNGPVQIGGVGTAILNIGDNDSGLRSSKDGQVDLWANSKVMGYWNTTTFSFTGQIIPTNYSNFDGRYYTKTESDSRFQPKGNYTPAGQAYTKAESDGRYQPKGNYTPAGQAYTKAESNARFLQGWRLGANANATNNNGGAAYASAPNGAVVTGVAQKTDWTAVNYRYAQYNLNGTWYNAGVL